MPSFNVFSFRNAINFFLNKGWLFILELDYLTLKVISFAPMIDV